jgi:hypothetical protein
MDVNVKVTIDLGDKTLQILKGLTYANPSASDTAIVVCKTQAESADAKTCGTEEEFKKPIRGRRSHKVTDETQMPPLSGGSTPDSEDSIEPEPVYGGNRSNEITRDDIRNLLSEVIENEESNRMKVLKRLGEIGAKSVSTIKDEDIIDFFEFLKSLMGEYNVGRQKA